MNGRPFPSSTFPVSPSCLNAVLTSLASQALLSAPRLPLVACPACVPANWLAEDGLIVRAQLGFLFQKHLQLSQGKYSPRCQSVRAAEQSAWGRERCVHKQFVREEPSAVQTIEWRGKMSEEIAFAVKTFHGNIQQNHTRTRTYWTPAAGPSSEFHIVLLSGSLGSLSSLQHRRLLKKAL